MISSTSSSSSSSSNGEQRHDSSLTADFAANKSSSNSSSSAFPDANIDKALADELNGLSIKEREQCLHDVHGVADVIQESPELLSTSLTKLRAALERKRTKTYSLAELMGDPESYVLSREFRLMFLRADDFNVEEAADRMMRHLENKLELFGPARLCQKITQAELTPEDFECLQNGHLQILPVRDRAGRVIMMFLPPFLKYHQPENVVR
jgi:uncharacterized protein YehS (DUF1456 family)